MAISVIFSVRALPPVVSISMMAYNEDADLIFIKAFNQRLSISETMIKSAELVTFILDGFPSQSEI